MPGTRYRAGRDAARTPPVPPRQRRGVDRAPHPAAAGCSRATESLGRGQSHCSGVARKNQRIADLLPAPALDFEQIKQLRPLPGMVHQTMRPAACLVHVDEVSLPARLNSWKSVHRPFGHQDELTTRGWSPASRRAPEKRPVGSKTDSRSSDEAGGSSGVRRGRDDDPVS